MSRVLTWTKYKMTNFPKSKTGQKSQPKKANITYHDISISEQYCKKDREMQYIEQKILKKGNLSLKEKLVVLFFKPILWGTQFINDI